ESKSALTQAVPCPQWEGCCPPGKPASPWVPCLTRDPTCGVTRRRPVKSGVRAWRSSADRQVGGMRVPLGPLWSIVSST
ncbi:unnamed protein product, partial [Gulo gulo]